MSSEKRGSLTAVVRLETSDQVVEVPVSGYASDGQESLDDVHAHLTGANTYGAAGAAGASNPLASPIGRAARGGRGPEARAATVAAEASPAIPTIVGDHEGWFGETSSTSAFEPPPNQATTERPEG